MGFLEPGTCTMETPDLCRCIGLFRLGAICPYAELNKDWIGVVCFRGTGICTLVEYSGMFLLVKRYVANVYFRIP